MTNLIAKVVYRPTDMGFINVLEHLRVVIIQDAAEMLISGRTHYLFEFVKVVTITLETVVE
jgi:hypothetical protein